MAQHPSSPADATADAAGHERAVAIKPFATTPATPLSRGRGHSTKLFDLSNGAVNADIHINVLLPGAPSGPYHYHKQSENFYHIMEGSIRLIVEGEEYIINANDTVFIPPGLKHRVEHVGSIPTRFVEIYAPSAPDFHLVEDEAQNPKTGA